MRSLHRLVALRIAGLVLIMATTSDVFAQTWIKYTNAIPAASDTSSTAGRIPLGSSGKGDSVHVGYPCVMFENGAYRMWYSGHDGVSWRIYHATSSNGLDWIKTDNTVPVDSDTTSTNGRLALGTAGRGDFLHVYYPVVIKEDGVYRMWYTGSDGAYQRIYYATSPDGLTWTKYNNAIPTNSNSTGTGGRVPLGQSGSGDDYHVIGTVVLKWNGLYRMWYTGHDGSVWRIYHATSSDGLAWLKEDNSIPAISDTISTAGRIPLGTNGMGDDAHTYAPNVLADDALLRLWYGGHDGSFWRVYHAVSSDGLVWAKRDNTVPPVSNTNSTNGRIPLGGSGLGDAAGVAHTWVVQEDSEFVAWYMGYDGTSWRLYRAVHERTCPTVRNVGATNIATSAADCVGELISTGAAPAFLEAFWGTTNGGFARSGWEGQTNLGAYGIGFITNHLTGLTAATRYYFTFCSTNTLGEDWANEVGMLSTEGAPQVRNNAATKIGETNATLHGDVVVGYPTPTAWFCWGTNNAGRTSTGLWEHVVGVGPTLGECETAVGLLANQTCFFCLYATNAYGGAWADSVTNFVTLSPTISIAAGTVTEPGGIGATTTLVFSLSLSSRSAIEVAVDFATSNGTATAGLDYNATNGTLRFSPGMVATTICVTVLGDTNDEYPSESLFLALSAPSNAALATNQAQSVIVDDGDTVTETKIWNGGTGSWAVPTNWTPSGVPGPTDTVIMNSGTCTLSQNSGPLAAFSNSATLIFNTTNARLQAVNICINGAVTHNINTDISDPWEMDNGVHFVCSNFTLLSGKSIDVNYKGWQGKQDGSGYGPGRSLADRGAAGHGGEGSIYGSWIGPGGPTYGVSNAPVLPGSGGNGAYGSTGGHGGGAVRIDASGHVLINGSVVANGGPLSLGSNLGGGSGGSIYITCATLGGTNGLLSADGGNGYQGGGGGGRIAVICANPTAQAALPRPGVSFSVLRGAGGYINASNGTVYLSHALLIPETMNHMNGFLMGPSDWAMAMTSFSATDSRVYFPDGLSGIAMTVSSNFVLSSSIIDVGPSSVSGSPLVLKVGGDMVLTNGAVLYVYSGPTNGASTNYGGLVSVTGSLTIASNSWLRPVSHRTDGGSVLIAVSNVTVAAFGCVDADSGGYGPGYGAGKTSGAAGGGYGGKGGSVGATQGGATYGSSNAPIEPGSGSTYEKGGGNVRIEARDTVRLDGSILARGASGASGRGGGAGGGVFITCRCIAGDTGIITANGGNTSGSAGGGGGGRIAARFASDQLGTNNVTASGGTNSTSASYNGTNGTVVWIWDASGHYALWVEGAPVPRGVSLPYDYGQNAVEPDEVVTLSVPSPTDESAGQHYTCTGWMLSNSLGVVDSGVSTQAVFTMTTNLYLRWQWTNGWLLDTRALTNGSLLVDRDGWYTNGVSVNIQAVPDGGKYFVQWIGEVPYEDRVDNPLMLTMDRRRWGAAAFADLTPGTKTWSGTGNWYYSPGNWVPPGVPGIGDQVVIPTGTVCTIDECAAVAGLTVAGTLRVQTTNVLAQMTVAGNVTITGATARLDVSGAVFRTSGSLSMVDQGDLYVFCSSSDICNTNIRALVEVTGGMNVSSGSWVYPSSHATLGGSALFKVGWWLRILPGGGFNADGRGYQGFVNQKGYGPGASPADRGSAGYGGSGGGNQGMSSPPGYGLTYGSSNAPVLPGSSGGGYYGEAGGHGGGCVRIVANGSVVLDGTITAKGGNAGPSNCGSGSGGGIMIECHRFLGSGTLNANGGNTANPITDFYGAGGGGRIAVWCMELGFNTNNATVSAGTGFGTPPATAGTIVWGFRSIAGSFIVFR